MKLGGPVKLGAIGTVILAWCAGLAVKADYTNTVLSQGPVGYWRLNETAQPTTPRPAADIGSLGTAADGQYLFGLNSRSDGRYFLGPTRGQPGALIGG